MSCFESNTRSALLKRSLQFSLCILCFLPITASAEHFLFLQKSPAADQTKESDPIRLKPQMGVGFNDRGDLMVHYRKTSLTIAYNPAENTKFQQFASKTVLQEPPTIAGISLAFSVIF